MSAGGITIEDDVLVAANANELMEQREQNQGCLSYAEIPELSSPTRSLSRQKKTEGQKIKQLYETAFPKDEQIPWDDLMRLVGEMSLDFTAYYEGEEFIGFTIVYPRKSFNWFWYFAVREDLRGKGYGQQILTQLIERYKGQPFVLDMESTTQVCDNLAQRKRRQAFYLRNGFRDTHVYRTYNDIIMTIMMKGEGTFTIQDWDDITNELKQFWWPSDIEAG